MNALCTLVLAAAGLIHLLPVTGVLGGEHLRALYGLQTNEPSLSVLLRHRAVLFAVVGLLLIGGAVHTPWRWPALAAGLLSTLSFIVITALEGGGNAAIARVVRVDVIACLGLLIVLTHDVVAAISRSS
ncbi:MAG: phosphopantetheine adenylyltransferase [Stenotrophobium sp.]